MPKKKEGYENAAASIFDFIFASSNAKVKPPKPPKPSKASGNEMAQALGEIAMRPLMYSADQVFTPINESVGKIKLASSQTKIDQQTTLKLDVSAGNYADFLSDPESFIDKAFTKAENGRKEAKRVARIRGMGGAMDLGLAAVWAASNGMSATEAIRFGYDLGNEHMSTQQRNRAAEKLGARSSVFEVSQSVGGRMTSEQADQVSEDFYDVLDSARVTGIAKSEAVRDGILKNNLSKKIQARGYSQAEADHFADSIIAVHKNNERNYGLTEKGEVKTVDSDWNLGDTTNIGFRTSAINADRKKREEKQQQIRDEMGGVGTKEQWRRHNRLNQEVDPATKFRAVKMAALDREMKKLRDEMGGVGTAAQWDQYSKLEKEFKMIAVWQQSNAKGLRFSRLFGEASQHLQAWNSMVVEGKGLSSILDGSFFNDEDNIWSPSTETSGAIDVVKGLDGVKLKVARNDVFRFYKSANAIYYFTPGSIARTLFVNGEGFVYLGYLKQKGIKDTLMKSDDLRDWIISYAKANPNITTDPFWQKLFPGVDVSTGVFDFNAENADIMDKLAADYDTSVAKLKELVDNGSLTDPRLAELVKKLDKTILKLKNSKTLKYAKTLNDFWKKINIKEGAINFINKIGVKVLGKKVFEKISMLSVTLRQVVSSGVKVAVQAILQAIGVATTGGLANILIFIGTEVVFFIGEKLLKPVVKIATFFIWAFTLLFFLIIFGVLQFLLGSSTQEKFDTASYVPPQDIRLCPATLPYEITEDDASGINCNQNAPDISVPGTMGKAEFVSLADRWTSKPGKHYAEECYNDVVCSALSVGMDPAFALMVWINESGASRYGVIPEPIEDFGIHRPDVAKQDFNAQITAFLALSHEYCPELGDPLLGWATMYLTGHCDPDAEVCGGSRCNTGRGYAANMQNVWNWVSGGRPWPTKVKDASRATGQNCGERPKTPGGGNTLPPEQWPPMPPGWSGSCPIGTGSISCTQGPNGGFSHAAMGSAAIDTSLGTQYWQAPIDGSVSVLTDAGICNSDGSNYGGIMWFEGDDGASYRLIHVAPVVRSGRVKEGDVIARVLTLGEITAGDCWTGAHWHMDLKVNGSWVNAEEWYRNRLKCNLSSCP